MRLVANIVERDLPRVQEGVRARIGVDAFPGESFIGYVARIAPVLDPATRTAEIEIEVPNPEFYMGVIVLGGLVVNNAILLVDYTNILRRRDGIPLREAVEQAGRTRLRPILMTTITTLLGMVPMALGIGEGSELQAPLARVIIGGLLSSTVVTLVVVPVVYTLFEEGWQGAQDRPKESMAPVSG